MFREANAENSSEEPGRETEEIQVVEVEGEVEEVEVLGKVDGATPWLWNSLICSSCSKRCDDLALQGINISLSSCGHFYCNNCSLFYSPNNDNYRPCPDCKSLIGYLDKVALF